MGGSDSENTSFIGRYLVSVAARASEAFVRLPERFDLILRRKDTDRVDFAACRSTNE